MATVEQLEVGQRVKFELPSGRFEPEFKWSNGCKADSEFQEGDIGEVYEIKDPMDTEKHPCKLVKVEFKHCDWKYGFRADELIIVDEDGNPVEQKISKPLEEVLVDMDKITGEFTLDFKDNGVETTVNAGDDIKEVVTETSSNYAKGIEKAVSEVVETRIKEEQEREEKQAEIEKLEEKIAELQTELD